MRLMGRHSPPVNGTVIANGHAPVMTRFSAPLALQVGGDISGWPQQPDDAPPDVKGERRQRVTSALRVIFTHRGWLAAVPVILVNAVAFGAQLGFWNAHLPVTAEAVLVALALESIAISLAGQAHLAQLADDSALRLRLAAYGMALAIGVLNYSHFDGPGWQPTVPAVTFGMMSAISPWLWSVHSRRASRDALKAKGLIEPHAVRLGGTRWTWHPIRSVRVMSAATWAGETDPAKAIATWRPGRSRKTADPSPDISPEPSPDPAPDPSPEGSADRQDEPSGDAGRTVRPKPRKHTPAPSARARALAVMKDNPALTDAEIIKRAKVSESTVTRARKELAKADG